jgi:glycine oxidase
LNSDFLIIGAGVVGLGSALALIQQGAKVTVIERGFCGRESSWAGGGILSPLCPWDYSEEVTQLAGRGAALFPAWASALHQATGIDPEYHISGMLILPPFDAQTAKLWCASHNVPVEQIQSTDHSLPILNDALSLPQVAQVRNPRLMQALRNRVEMLGGLIIEQCEVRELVVMDESVNKVVTSTKDFSADNFVVTAGAWSKQVLGQYALEIDIKPMRGQMLLFKFPEPPLRQIILQDDLYLIPRQDGHLLAGSTLEDVGFDKSITQIAHDSLRSRAEKVLPQLSNFQAIQHWAGLRPGSLHNIPTIGRHPQLKNLYLNSGHFRYGVTMATASVEILVNEIMKAPQPLDVSPYQTGWGTS